MDVSLRYFLVKFRTSNHRLPIEEGRFIQIARADRKCLVCDSNDIGDELRESMVHVLWDRVFTTSHQSFRASRRRARNDLVTSRENTIPQDINHGFLFSPVILHNNKFTETYSV